jgi:hypothetical protein
MNQNTVGLDQNTVGLDQNTVKMIDENFYFFYQKKETYKNLFGKRAAKDY